MYSKTGCRTCKIRKVKCDEGYPVCHKCVSTGRACEGYAIWGKFGISIRQPLRASSFNLSSVEGQCFDWFKVRTITKLPGSFLSEFWSRLLLQATLHEPAILHASLALSAVHKTAIVDREPSKNAEMEKFALRHYVKAIDLLKPHFSAKSKMSFQVILTACIVFASLDCLRGHFASAQKHIYNGTRIVKEANHVNGNQSPTQSDFENDWIIETLFRLEIQLGLLKQSCLGSNNFLLKDDSLSVPRKFRSLKEAWKSLGCLASKVLELTHADRGRKKSGMSANHHLDFSDQRQAILRALRRWHSRYQSSIRSILGNSTSPEENKGSIVPLAHHTMLTMMAEVCQHSDDEMIFDSQTDRFIQLLDQLLSLFDLSQVGPDYPTVTNTPIEKLSMARSIMDLGCLAPLSYLVVKCRVHSIRVQAIGLLESAVHREGIWDSKTTALIARKVMELEERGFYSDIVPDDLDGCHKSQDLPVLPETHRIVDLEVILSGDPIEKISLFGSKPEARNVRICIAEYSVSSAVWVDL